MIRVADVTRNRCQWRGGNFFFTEMQAHVRFEREEVKNEKFLKNIYTSLRLLKASKVWGLTNTTLTGSE